MEETKDRKENEIRRSKVLQDARNLRQEELRHTVRAEKWGSFKGGAGGLRGVRVLKQALEKAPWHSLEGCQVVSNTTVHPWTVPAPSRRHGGERQPQTVSYSYSGETYAAGDVTNRKAAAQAAHKVHRRARRKQGCGSCVVRPRCTTIDGR
jgi:hypothetical protein